jgi:hypothetical protein
MLSGGDIITRAQRLLILQRGEWIEMAIDQQFERPPMDANTFLIAFGDKTHIKSSDKCAG